MFEGMSSCRAGTQCMTQIHNSQRTHRGDRYRLDKQGRRCGQRRFCQHRHQGSAKNAREEEGALLGAHKGKQRQTVQIITHIDAFKACGGKNELNERAELPPNFENLPNGTMGGWLEVKVKIVSPKILEKVPSTKSYFLPYPNSNVPCKHSRRSSQPLFSLGAHKSQHTRGVGGMTRWEVDGWRKGGGC